MPVSICKRLSVFLLACLAIWSPTAVAQTGTTSLHGAVLDKSHATVAGAKVTLVNDAQGLQRETVTPSSGEFEFLALAPGGYTLSVEKQGFSKYVKTDVQLLVNVPSTVNITLQVGTLATSM